MYLNRSFDPRLAFEFRCQARFPLAFLSLLTVLRFFSQIIYIYAFGFFQTCSLSSALLLSIIILIERPNPLSVLALGDRSSHRSSLIDHSSINIPLAFLLSLLLFYILQRYLSSLNQNEINRPLRGNFQRTFYSSSGELISFPFIRREILAFQEGDAAIEANFDGTHPVPDSRDPNNGPGREIQDRYSRSDLDLRDPRKQRPRLAARPS